MFTIFDCLTKQRVSDRSYATVEEASHDYYMNQGHTYIGVIAQHSDPAPIQQEIVSPAPSTRPLEGSGLITQHAEGPNVSAPFTPGPWRIDLHGEGHNRNKLFAIEAKDHFGIMRWVVDRVRGGNKQQTLANARLIAAAPDLFAVLKGIANADQSTWEPEYRTPQEFKAWAQNIARHAIAKATGGAA